MNDRHQFDADGFEPGVVLGEAAAPEGGGLAALLELLPRRGFAGAQAPFDLVFGRCFPLGLRARRDPGQAMIPFDFPHQRFLAPVVLGVAHHCATVGDPACEYMNMLVVGIGVAGDDVLIVHEPHPPQVSLTDRPPLLVAQDFTGRGGQ